MRKFLVHVARWTAAIMVVSVVAACSGGRPDAGFSPRSDAQAEVAAGLRNLSQADGSTVEEGVLEHLRIPGVEGHLLDTWIVRPAGEEPVPVVLVVTPYYGGSDPRQPFGLQLDGHALGKLGDVLVPRGYAVGISSVRGTGNSEGCFSQGGPQEARDTAAVIQAVAEQPWSNGNVGLIGVSYDGTTPQDVWVEAPPALKTVVPISGISDYYKYNFVNGVPIDIQGLGFNTYYWPTVGLSPVGLSGGSQVGDPQAIPGAVIGEVCQEQVDVQWGGISSTLDGNKDGYWQERDFLAELRAASPRPRASVFYIHGLQDWNVKPHMMEDWLAALQASGVPFKAWLGQWGHAWPQASSGPCNPGQACRNDWWETVLVAWMDQFLKGVDTGVLDLPAVQVQDDTGRWRHEDEWPPADVRWDTWYLDAEGLKSEGPGQGVAEYFDYWGQQDAAALQVGGPDRVLFRSAPLPEAMTISGLPEFAATVTASGERASLILTLAEETEDGQLRAFNFAALSLNHASSLQAGLDDVSDLAQDVQLRFFPQDDHVRAGNRLVLIAAGNIVGSPGPALIPIATGSTISFDLASARLRIPVDTSLQYESPQPFDAQ